MKFELIIDAEKEEKTTVVAHSANDFIFKLEDLVRSYNGDNRMVGFRDDEIKPLEIDKIECFIVLGRKSYAVDIDGKKYRISENLSSIENRLPSYFVRINKSAIANERRIKCFKRGFGGSVDAVFKSGFSEYVSRRCFSDLKRRYGI